MAKRRWIGFAALLSVGILGRAACLVIIGCWAGVTAGGLLVMLTRTLLQAQCG